MKKTKIPRKKVLGKKATVTIKIKYSEKCAKRVIRSITLLCILHKKVL